MEEYKRIRYYLLQKKEKWEDIHRRQDQAARNAGRQIEERRKQLQDEYDKVKVRIARVNAYLVMAESKKCDHVEPSQGKKFDNVIMAQLAVQLNSAEGRIYASKLYTEAKAQKMELEQIAATYEYERDSLSKQNGSGGSGMEEGFSEEISVLKHSVDSFFHSEEFYRFKDHTVCLTQAFSGWKRLPISQKDLAIGSIPLDIFTAQMGEELFKDWNKVDFSYGKDLAIPLVFDMTRGQVFLAEFEPVNEAHVIAGLQNVLYNFLLHRSFNVKQIIMVDPVRNNDTALGALSEICGMPGSPVSRVPKDPVQIRQTIGSLLESLKEEEKHRKNSYEDREIADRLVIFHDFPVGYDSEQVRWVQELCVSARHYGVVVFVTFNKSAEANKFIREAVNMITGYAACIYSEGNRFYVEGITEKSEEFVWFAAPPSLTVEEIELFQEDEKTKSINNRYEHNVDISSPRYLKGKRSLDDIPYGLDANGMLQTLDFEDSNFAYYICGASRSGKSTLLHTIISGILATTHPDDVEIWLVDFKKTEFSRYIDHLPPHIRYVVLDESPELVYDIINRLTEILHKRQNLFMGKWEKLSHVPATTYMPEIFIIIDEFSKMSQVLADSILGSGGDYTVKLQNLLTAGAAFGFKFIFSSQDFSEGTRGLTSTAKKQIQQRIAMYSKELGEIKATLGLSNASDSDIRMMENLEVHYTLMRIPEDSEGNHLKLAKPLFFAEREIEFDFIDKINQAVHPVQKYIVDDVDGYIYKRPLIIDGNSYTDFLGKRAELQKEIIARQEENETLISLGDPKRLIPIHLVTILDSYGENILMIVASNESECAVSVVYTTDATAKMQGRSTHLWAYKRAGIYKKMAMAGNPFEKQADTIEKVCREIKDLREKIEKKIMGNDFYFLIGIDSYIADMAYLPKKNGASSASKKVNEGSGNLVFEARKEGELDLMSQMNLLKSGNAVDSYADKKSNMDVQYDRDKDISHEPDAGIVSDEYDAREDLKYILTQGPRLGYHFFTVFSTLQEIKLSKIRLDDFKHRILFKTSKTEAAEVMNAANAGIIQSLDDHTFRYSNGIESLNLRPYIHEGLTWSGMGISDEEEEEYLM